MLRQQKRLRIKFSVWSTREHSGSYSIFPNWSLSAARACASFFSPPSDCRVQTGRLSFVACKITFGRCSTWPASRPFFLFTVPATRLLRVYNCVTLEVVTTCLGFVWHATDARSSSLLPRQARH